MDNQQTQKSLSKVSLLPKSSTIAIGLGDRAVGGLVSAQTVTPPKSDGDADLMRDTFFALWKSAPQVLEKVQPEREVNKAVMEWAMSDKDFMASREATMLNIPASVGAAPFVWSSLRTNEAVKEALEKQQQAEDMKKDADQLDKAAAREAQQEFPQQDVVDKYLDEAKAKRELAKKLAQQGVEKIEKLKVDPVQKYAIGTAAKQGKEKADQITALCRGWGIDPGTDGIEELGDVLKYANDPNFAELNKIMGRLRGICAQVLAGHKRSDTGVVAEVAMTKDISRLFLEELATLNVKSPRALRAKKLRELTTSGLLGYRPLEEKKHSGAFIMYVDKSGSMSGEPYQAAAGMAVGIAKATQDELEEGRIYEVYGFSDRVHGDGINQASGWKEHIEWATHYSGGGTSFNDVFEHAVKRVQELAALEVQPDVVILTDGASQVDKKQQAAWEALKEQCGVRLITLNIGTWGYEQIEALSDTFLRFDSAKEFAAAVEDIARQIADVIGEHQSSD